MLSWAAVATGSLSDTHKKQYSVCNRHVTLAVTMTCLLQNVGSDGRKLPSKQAQTAEEDGKADWTEEKADCS